MKGTARDKFYAIMKLLLEQSAKLLEEFTCRKCEKENEISFNILCD